MKNLQKLYLKNLSEAICRQSGLARSLKIVLMADDSQVLASGSVNFRNFRSDWLTSLRVRNRNMQLEWLLIPYGCRRRDDGWHCSRGKNEGSSSTAGNYRIVRRRDGDVMHPMIVINGSNIVTARLSVGQRRQVPLRQRGELSARLCHAAAPALDLSRVRSARCCVTSPRSGKTRPIRSHGTYLMDITERNSRISFHQQSRT